MPRGVFRGGEGGTFPPPYFKRWKEKREGKKGGKGKKMKEKGETREKNKNC